ncbi:hypothetical protein E2L06_13850 [Haloterrigena sp. H1]|uniref:DUF7289 family protein n=1 Tax=Haloterrigena sp. H1 TaxID=2552943 RepID=UPI00110D5771|nr:hypothetical protein [Haloterrigena sp. H1]TMT87608.1 hypothetical protein E2L06_13850 [Haloterrigena sp. H1]
MLGLVLLIGAVAVASVGIIMLGSSGLDTQQAAIETDYAEQSMLEFAHSTKTTVSTGRGPSDVSLGPFDRGHVSMRETAGRVTMTRVNDSGGTEVLYNESLGTLAYANGDTEIAYQGGGVWRTDGTGSAMVSEPGIEYRNGTLSFPIVHLDGNRAGGNAVDGTVRQAATPTQVALDGRSNSESVTVRIAIQSAYCSAWERELEDSLEGSVTESCDEGEPQRVRIQLISPTENSRALDGAVIGETVNAAGLSESTGKQMIDGNARAGTIDEWMVSGTVSHENYDYPSADEEIDRSLEACDEFEALDGPITEPGVHCVDEIGSGHHFDTSNGDIAVVVRKSFDLSGSDSLSVTGSNDLTIYAGEDLDVKGNAVIGNASDPSQTRLVFSSGSTVQTVSGTPEINALLYAPESTVDIKGTPTIVGTVVGDDVTIHDVAAEIRGDDSLATLEFIPGAGPHVPYATVTAYEAELDD